MQNTDEATSAGQFHQAQLIRQLNNVWLSLLRTLAILHAENT